MRGRHGYLLLTLVTGLAAPAGCCTRWQCFAPPMFAEKPPAANARLAGELTSAQAAQLCLAAGEDLERRGFTVEAIRQLENARQHDPAVRGVSRHLAVLYDLQGEAARAETEYRRALEEQANNAELLNDFGYFQYRHNHLPAAENWLRAALRVDPSCSCAWVNLGQVLACQGRSEESYRAFAQVLRPAEAYSNLGILLAKQGHSAEARRALEQAIALEPGLQQPRAFLRALNGSMPGLLPPGLTASMPAPAAKPAPPLPAVAPSPVPSPPPIPQPQAAPMTARSNPAPVVPTPRSSPPAAAISRPVSNLPSIVNGPLQPVPLAPPRPALTQTADQVPAMPANRSSVSRSTPATIHWEDGEPAMPGDRSIAHKSPPPPPAPPPPLPPFAPPPPRHDDEEGPILIRTSAIEVQPVVPVKTSSPGTPKPASTLPVAKRSVRPSSAPPRAVLTDCQSDAEPHDPK